MILGFHGVLSRKASNREGLSLQSLDLETELGAALQTGRAPKSEKRDPVDKSHQSDKTTQ
jgi:hypothetical protein